MNSKLKAAGSTVGAIALLTPAMAAALPIEAQAIDAPECSVQAVEATAAQETSTISVQGSFSYDQNVTTSTQAVVNVFNKAAASLCAALPQYAVDAQGRAICVKSPNTALVATVDELSEGDTVTYTMGCACASNGPGGGAVMNAEVSGVSLASVAQKANA